MKTPNSKLPNESWWWCKHCHAFVELVDPGAPYPQCEKCRARVYLKEPDASAKCEVRSAESKGKAMPAVDWNEEAKPLTRTKRKDRAGRAGPSRLPREKRNLFELAKTGFWFCYQEDCKQITERGADGCCVFCGRALDEAHDWSPPVFEEKKENHQPKAA